MSHHHPRLPTVLCSGVTDKARQSFDWAGRWGPQQHTCASGSGSLPRRSPHKEDQGWITGTQSAFLGQTSPDGLLGTS